MTNNKKDKVPDSKYTMKQLVDLIEKIKLKYKWIAECIKRLDTFKELIIDGDYSASDNDKEAIDILYSKINEVVEIENIKSKFDFSNIEDIEFNEVYSFILNDIAKNIINLISLFDNNNKKLYENNDYVLYNLKIIECSVLDKFIYEFLEEQQILKEMFDIYKNEYYKQKKLLKKPASKDELKIDNLIDNENEIIQ